jgi:hypothetical protein
VHTAAEVGMMTILLLLNFSKAFNCVRQDLLLPKLVGVESDLRSVEFWTERNGLKLNAQKMQMICMGTSRGIRSVKAYVWALP